MMKHCKEELGWELHRGNTPEGGSSESSVAEQRSQIRLMKIGSQVSLQISPGQTAMSGKD